jgi:DNA repair protein RecO
MTRARGIVLGRKRFGESSDVVRFLSDELGLLSFAALGRRRLKSRMRAALEPLSYSEVVLYERKGDVWLAKEATLLRDFREITRDLTTFGLVGRLFRLLEDALPPFGPVEGLVPLLLDFLSVAETGGNPRAPYCLALIRTTELLGLGPNLSRCSCGNGKPVGFSLESGVVCEDCEKETKFVELSPEAINTLARLEGAGWPSVKDIAVGEDVTALLEAYAREHLSGVP